MNELFNEIHSKISKQKNIVLIAGASASGKSYMAEHLKNYLQGEGLRVAQFSSDMYYKGIARIITEKTFLHNVEFISYLSKCPEISSAVKSVICNYDFPNKFCDENYVKINNYLKSVMPTFVADKFAVKLKQEFERINFDEPFCIDFVKLYGDINTLNNGGTIYIPKYSFKTGESELDYNNKVSNNLFDVIIIEGIYALRDELLNNIDMGKTVSVAINCDPKTLLTRRFNRDINSGRCSSTPEQVIVSFLTQTMPAFYAYIYPTLSRADITYNTTLSNNEIQSSEKSIQIKYFANNNVNKSLKQLGAKLVSTVNQKDYYLEDKTDTGKCISLRIREENGYATKLSIKVKTTKLERAIQEYNLVDIMSKENRKIEGLLNIFKQSGYETLQVVNKTRKEYLVNGSKVKVDNVKDVGVFVEIDVEDLKKVTEIKNLLSLNNATTKSYFDLYLENITNLSHVECEKKFVVKGINREVISGIFKEYSINQYYLNLNDSKVVQKIDKTLNSAFNLSGISEARVRVINNADCYLTLKSNGGKVREEIEKEIPITLAKELISSATSYVSKGRYQISERNGMKVELDFYNNSSLNIMEIEYDDNEHSDQEVVDFASNLFGDSVTVTDVTDNKEFKNVNLATEYINANK